MGAAIEPRDLYAAHAMNGLIASGFMVKMVNPDDEKTPPEKYRAFAAMAFNLADAMMNERATRVTERYS